MKMYFNSKAITDRSKHDDTRMSGGALNANYQDVEASIAICTRLGQAGYSYKEDFYFITCGIGAVVLEFYNEECASVAAMLLSDAIIAT
jgi:hypothetical protein